MPIFTASKLMILGIEMGMDFFPFIRTDTHTQRTSTERKIRMILFPSLSFLSISPVKHFRRKQLSPLANVSFESRDAEIDME